jgi:hypothetical protein
MKPLQNFAAIIMAKLITRFMPRKHPYTNLNQFADAIARSESGKVNLGTPQIKEVLDAAFHELNRLEPADAAAVIARLFEKGKVRGKG